MPSDLRRERDNFRKEKRRQCLLDAATTIFIRQGYHKTLISDITTEASVGQGTFYRHFKDKRELFETLFERMTNMVFGEFSTMTIHLPQDIEEYRLSSVEAVQRVAANLEKNRDLVLLIVREAPTIDRSFGEKLAEFYQGAAGLAQLYLDHAVEQGFARSCNTKIVSQSIIGMAVWMANNWWSGQIADASLKEVIEEVMDFAFKGISPNVGPNRGEKEDDEL